mmetsp:Transcript_18912/g.43989  ORF Transcript_18912/g.43989 Transcript_18912/m.43989 type:complete len:119 (-) Transcript_18912:298-654(-)
MGLLFNISLQGGFRSVPLKDLSEVSTWLLELSEDTTLWRQEMKKSPYGFAQLFQTPLAWIRECLQSVDRVLNHARDLQKGSPPPPVALQNYHRTEELQVFSQKPCCSQECSGVTHCNC